MRDFAAGDCKHPRFPVYAVFFAGRLPLTDSAAADIRYAPSEASRRTRLRTLRFPAHIRMEAKLAICVALGALGIAQALLMLLHAWEHRRYHRSRLIAEPKAGPQPRVTLFVPCKGVDPGMEANLRALFEQRYAALDLCFLIESESDPAIAIVRRLEYQHPHVRCRVIFTGTAENCGQKVHNLMRGTATLPADAEVLAFVDSDARPHPHWLSRLVERLRGDKFAVATGYRWYVPARPTLANHLLSAINNTVAGLMGPHGYNLVWGGAWAIRTETFRRLGLPQAWRGSLSDDLVVSRLVHSAELNVAYEPHCLVRSTADFTTGALAEFVRRQYLVARVYAPTWWRFAVLSAGMTNAVFVGLAGFALAWLISGGPWKIPALSLLSYYLLTALRYALTARAMRPFVDVTNTRYERVARFNVWGWPLVSTVVGLGLAASAVGRSLVWRGVQYRLDSPSETTILHRTPEAGTSQPLVPSPSNRAA